MDFVKRGRGGPLSKSAKLPYRRVRVRIRDENIVCVDICISDTISIGLGPMRGGKLVTGVHAAQLVKDVQSLEDRLRNDFRQHRAFEGCAKWS